MKIILSAVLLATSSSLCFGQGKIAPPPTVTPLTILGIMGPVKEVRDFPLSFAWKPAPPPTVTHMTIIALMPLRSNR